MKSLAAFGLWFLVGYYTVTKAMPYVVAKVESLDIDAMWDVFDAEEQA
jgi:hypothetical protein